MNNIELKQSLTVMASQLHQQQSEYASPRIRCSHASLNDLLKGGLGWGDLSEWGLPWGSGLRELILDFIANAQASRPEPTWVLWIYGQLEIKINPLAWHARGIRLEMMRFVASNRPTSELKPLFLSHVFRIIVLDSVSQLNAEDFAFLANQARSLKQHIAILHPRPLSTGQGNVWARVRLNCTFDFGTKEVRIHSLKGKYQNQLLLLPQNSWKK